MYYITYLFHTHQSNIPIAGDSTVDPSRYSDYYSHAYIYQPHAEYAVAESLTM